jgi:flavin reductase (DIM6/NTAB) family NADH-FMN oxidoreductase RutF
MLFDMETLPPQDRYKLLTASVVPRPIAWVTTKSRAGIVNAAPFSFFNAMGSDPPTVVLGIMPRGERHKDTAANIEETAEFVVNMVSETNAEAMNLTCIDAPPEVDELELARLTPVPSQKVGPPRIGESPVAFECRLLASMVTGPLQSLVVGRIVCAHVDDAFVLDAKRCHLDTPALRLIGRMQGSGVYVRTADRFEMQRPSWAEWQQKHAK